MKLTTVLMFMCCLHISARSVSQTVTLRVKNVPLTKVFNEIKKQTGYTFIYTESLLKESKSVSLTFNRDPLEDVLTKCFSGQPFSYRIINKTVVVEVKSDLNINLNLSLNESTNKPIAVASKPPIEVRGRVVDEGGKPLIGASVGLKNNRTIGTTTNERGEYLLSFDGNGKDVLIFSSVGHNTMEIPINGRNVINVTLNISTSSLEDVVIVGYGTQKRENLTGSISQVDGSDIALRPVATINSALQGLLPGLNIKINNGDPTSNPDLNIRGFTSINGGSPLVLVDGIEGNMQDVNPIDIQSVTILKDASSSAIYGARGAFGVILITTKKGSDGDIRVNYSNNFSWTTPTTRTDFISDPYVYGKITDAAINGYNGSTFTNFNNLDWELMKMVADGEIEPFHELQSNGTYKFYYNTNWYDYLFRKYQPSQIHSVSVSGGNERLKAYMSGRIYDRSTINNFDDEKFVRNNINTSLTFKVTEWLKLSQDLKYSEEQHRDIGGYVNGYGGVWSTTTWYDQFPYYPTEIDGVGTDIGRSGSGGQGGAAAMKEGNNWRKFRTNVLTNTFRAELNPIKGLELNFDYSFRTTNENRTYRYSPFDFIDNNRLTMRTGGINRIGEFRWVDRYKALNAFGAYSRNINENHHFKLLLGFNQEEFDRDRISAQSNNVLIRELTNLSLATDFYNIDGSTLDWAIRGYFGRFNYDFKKKYLLEINTRYDGSSRFPSVSRWGFFPSFSAGWQISEEKFWKPMKEYASSFKLRGSYGKLGNQTVPVNTFQELMSVGQSDWLDENGQKLIYSRAPSPLPAIVTWEETKTIDLGVDIGFLNDRLLASVDWFQRETENMYLPGEPLPAVFGRDAPKENYGTLRNRGFELSLTYRDHFEIGGSPLRINATASLSNFKGVITRYNNPNGLMSTYWEGQKLGEIWGYHVDGQFQSDQEAAEYQNKFNSPTNDLIKVYKYVFGVVQNSSWSMLRAGDVKYIDTNGDGKIDDGENTLSDHGDLIPIGNAMPQFPFGFNINASWKNFDLSIAGAGVAKQDWYPTGDLYWGTYFRPYLSFIRKDLVTEAWTADSKGKYPQIYRGYQALGLTSRGRSLFELNDYYLTNVGFLRVKNFTVGYTFPEVMTKKVFIQKARIYFSGENLFTVRFGNLTKYIDPEQAGNAIDYSSPADAAARSAEYMEYPMGKTFSFGVQVTL